MLEKDIPGIETGEAGVVIVTGSSSGFGRLTAQTLARQGYIVFATMRGIDGKNAAAATALRDLAARERLALHPLELDVSEPAACATQTWLARRSAEPLGGPCAACMGTTSPGAQLPRAHEEALYYVAREALTNVVKHARTTHATVTLWWGQTVRLVVEDDGVGFGTPAESEPGAYTYGLAGMRERVAALGGRLLLENRPGGGARVVAELPVGKAADR
jgi:nitrate/nitrite-specific signal transduction histidine kinase